MNIAIILINLIIQDVNPCHYQLLAHEHHFRHVTEDATYKMEVYTLLQHGNNLLGSTQDIVHVSESNQKTPVNHIEVSLSSFTPLQNTFLMYKFKGMVGHELFFCCNILYNIIYTINIFPKDIILTAVHSKNNSIKNKL